MRVGKTCPTQVGSKQVDYSKKKSTRQLSILSYRLYQQGLFSITALFFLFQEGKALDQVAAVVNTTGYLAEAMGSMRKWLNECPKTYENEFNEAACGIGRDKLRRITENALDEINKLADSFNQKMEYNIAADFRNEFSRELAQAALKHVQKYELAITTLDFIEYTKKQLDETMDRLKSTLDQPCSARAIGEIKAKQLDAAWQEDVRKACDTVLVWKKNLLAALHQKYRYTCEGGIGDRWGRSFSRHKERGKYWGIEPDWWRGGAVEVPKINLSIENPFSDTDDSMVAQQVRNCHMAYKDTLDIILQPLECQIGINKLNYVASLQKRFNELFPTKASRSIHLDNKPELLAAYLAYLKQEPELEAADE
ncbi:hypothetical protein [Candidatus Odyssella thessalonicensis]|uniref:hypothetical protein n=1 Tax=Candidatus Odyssella thessalonicensis TaxID=84647 RepID=UPI00049806E0|nr:hypothetical protein [Candidatus Odyssella thessalonicensis]